MGDMAEQDSENNQGQNSKQMTKEELQAFLGDIEEKVINSNTAHMHSVISLNQLLRMPYLDQLLDEKLKEQMHDIWIKLKSLGVQLGDPPLLFGLPEGFGSDNETMVVDNDPEIEIVKPISEESISKRKEAKKANNGERDKEVLDS